MTLTTQQITLVQNSFQLVVPIAETAAALFYQRLFDTMPEATTLFKNTDIKEQGKKLMQMLTVAVAGLTKLEGVVPAVKALGARHVRYGVRDEVQEAWALVYSILAETAIAGAHEALESIATE